MKTIELDGYKFTRTKGRMYYYNTKIRRHLHQYIWEKKNNIKIPKGYEIHHKDFNALNNDIDNLELLSIKEHHKIHSKNITKERKEKMRQNLIENAIPKACEWHKSIEGKKWHLENYIKNGSKLRVKKIYKCDCCGKEFETLKRKGNKFCSNKCRSKYRRDKNTDIEIRKCIICGNDFNINKYYKTKTCSSSCGSKLSHIKRKENILKVK